MRIAQVNIKCSKCGKMITMGHEYTTVQEQIVHPEYGKVTNILRVHPECAEDKDETK